MTTTTVPPEAAAIAAYLRPAESAVYTSVSERTIRRAIAAGQLAALKCGRELRISRVALDAWAASGFPTTPAK